MITYTWKEALVGTNTSWSLLITSHDSRRRIPLGISLLGQQPTSSTTISCFALDFERIRKQIVSPVAAVVWNDTLQDYNGKAERFNQTLLSMLQTLPEEKKTKWSEYVPKVVHTYNCTKSESNGFSPFYLLFGRSPRLPVDLIFGPSLEDANVTHTEYADKWKVAMKEAYSLALKNTYKSATDGKRQYDRKVRVSNLQPGDRVLVRNLSERGGPGKLRSYWEQKIHVVTEQKGDLPIYKGSPEGEPDKPRVLHRNLLLPCDFLHADTQEFVPQPVQERRSTSVRTRQRKERGQQSNHNESDS